MPEKPEVITVAKTLKKELIGKKILNVEVYWNNIIAYPKVEDFCGQIRNQTINNITTRGKWLVFHLDDYFLLIHLRMEGKFFFRGESDAKNKHEHVFFYLNDNRQLRFADVRKFGKMHLILKKDVDVVFPLKDLGLEYYDKNLTGDYLLHRFKSKKTPIKTVLLDQTIIAGIGV